MLTLFTNYKKTVSLPPAMTFYIFVGCLLLLRYQTVGHHIARWHSQLAPSLVLGGGFPLVLMAPEISHLIHLRIEVCALFAHLDIGQVEVLPVQFVVDGGFGGIQDGHCPVAVAEGFEPEFQALVVAVMQALYAHLVLVDVNHLAVHDDVLRCLAHVPDVVTEDEW